CISATECTRLCLWIDAIEGGGLRGEFEGEFGGLAGDELAGEEVQDVHFAGEFDGAVSAFGGVYGEEVFVGVHVVVAVGIDVAFGSAGDVAEERGWDDGGGGVDGGPAVLLFDRKALLIEAREGTDGH